ncbi:hypothetical protein F4815DRAFT_501422 [Daldinia loculata]|nr:hypothetical protein F4815DRAFT_501422 [Daldinia loculata]
MAPQNPNNSNGAHKDTSKALPTQPAIDGAQGRVNSYGRYICQILVNGRPCGATMKNEKRNIRSHLSKKHRAQSAYAKNQVKTDVWPCPEKCGMEYKNFHSMLRHMRVIHRFTGKSAGLKEKSKNLRGSTSQTGGVSSDTDSGFDEEYIPPPDRPDRGPGGGSNQDPPGASGGSLIPAAA